MLASLKQSWLTYRKNQSEHLQALKANGGKTSIWRFFSLNLHVFMNMDAIRAAAREEALAVGSRHDVPSGEWVPADLQDTKGRFFRTREGYRITGRLLINDMMEGSASPAVPIFLALLPVLTLITVGMSHWGSFGLMVALLVNLTYLVMVRNLCGLGIAFMVLIVMSASQVLSVLATIPVAGMLAQQWVSLFPMWVRNGALFMLPTVFPLWYAHKQAHRRARELATQGSIAAIENTGKLSSAHEKARQDQAFNANKDTTAFMPYGIAKGIFTGKNDGYSPDEDLELGQTLNDLSTHKITFGMTGSGKSSRQALPDGLHYAQSGYGGLLVLDGKGTGPAEMAEQMAKLNLPYTLIDPLNNPTVQVALLEGLSPEDAVLAIQSAFVSKGGQRDEGAQFFENSGSTLLLHAAMALRSAVDIDQGLVEQARKEGRPLPSRSVKWTLQSWYQHVQDMQNPAFVKTFNAWIRANDPEAHAGGLLTDALVYMEKEFPKMDERTRSNTVSTVNAWLSPVMSHRLLKPWASLEHGFDVRSVCQGALVGARLPEFEYGSAGKLANSLIKALVFTEIRRRSKDWAVHTTQKPVMIQVDECQDIVGPSDLAILPVARSQGLICNYLTQHFDGLIVKLGEQQAHAFLGNFLSFVSYRSTPATCKWVQERLGTTESLVYTHGTLGIDYNYTANLALSSPYRDPNHPDRRRLKKEFQSRQVGKVSQMWKGAFKASGRELPEHLLEAATAQQLVTSAEIKIEPLLTDSEWDAYTSTPFVAVAQVQRGGVRRRDIITTMTIEEWNQRRAV